MKRNMNLDQRLDELTGRQHGAFLLDQLTDEFDRRLVAGRVCSGELDRVGKGAYVDPKRVDEWAIAAALCLRIPAAGVATTWAAQHWKLWGVEPASLQVLAPATCRIDHPAIVRTRSLSEWELRTERNGCLRFTDPDRTLVDLGGVLDLDHLERVVESAFKLWG